MKLKKNVKQSGRISKPKEPNLKLAKKKAWGVFSQYIRLKNADVNDLVCCVTCFTKKHWKEIHAGHFIDGRNNTVLYDERLVHPQCFHCNSKMPGCLGGNKVPYTIFMSKKYTMKEIEEFQGLYFNSKPMKAWEHLEIFSKYTKLFNQLVKDRENGIIKN